MDADGNDNTPEWGTCTHDGCHEDALLLWFAGDFPDDPDLLLCQKHIGLHIAGLTEVLRALWGAAGAITEGENTGDAECRYCHADEYPADEQGTEVEWEDEAATQYCINHEPWCPSFLIDRAFDGLDEALVARVLEGLSEAPTPIARTETDQQSAPEVHHGSFELRVDEDTGRRYWWGGEDGWKDPDEIGEDGVLIISAEHFAIGTVLTLREPVSDPTPIARTEADQQPSKAEGETLRPYEEQGS